MTKNFPDVTTDKSDASAPPFKINTMHELHEYIMGLDDDVYKSLQVITEYLARCIEESKGRSG